MARAEEAAAPPAGTSSIGASIRIEVVHCPRPGEVDLTPVRLPEGGTVADALRLSGVLQRYAATAAPADVGVWGRRCGLDRVLREGDRVECYRALVVDPKEARRLRYRKRERKSLRTPTAGA